MQAANGDLYLSNLLRLLALLDANNDTSDGFQIDAAANNAIGAAVTGTRTLDFAASAAAFASDATVVALATALNRTLVSADEALARYQLLFRQSRSSSIALTGDDTRAVVVNRQKASVSVIRVRNTDGSDASQLLAEIPVGKEPRFVAIAPNDRRAYVTNAVDGTMSVIDLTAQHAGGARQRHRRRRRAARHRDHAERHLRVHRRPHHGRRGRGAPLEQRSRRPRAHRRQSLRDRHQQRRRRNDNDERVYVTQLFGEVIDPARPDGFDDAKQGVVELVPRRRSGRRMRRTARGHAPAAQAHAVRLQRRPPQLLPADARRAADRGHGQVSSTAARTARGNGAAQLAKTTFCPDVDLGEHRCRRPHRPRRAEGLSEHAVRRAAARAAPLRAERRRAARAAGELQHQRAGARRRAEHR